MPESLPESPESPESIVEATSEANLRDMLFRVQRLLSDQA